MIEKYNDISIILKIEIKNVIAHKKSQNFTNQCILNYTDIDKNCNIIPNKLENIASIAK